jgi:hypothetical protein
MKGNMAMERRQETQTKRVLAMLRGLWPAPYSLDSRV